MLDVKFIRENQALVEKSTREKGYKTDIKALLKLDDERKNALAKVEELRARRNEISSQMKGGKPAPELIAEGKKIKEDLANEEQELDKLQGELTEMLKKVEGLEKYFVI